MGRKVCENVERKRELLYSFSSVVFIPILYYFAVTSAFKASQGPPVVHPGGGEAGGDGGAGTEVPLREEGGEVPPPVVTTTNSSTGEAHLMDWILERRELPIETVFYVVLLEVVKLFIVLTIYPAPHLFDQTPSLSSLWRLDGAGGGGIGAAGSSSVGVGGGRSSQGRLPFSKRDRENVGVKSPPVQVKIMEVWKGICNFVAACIVCHVFVVLLGAPIISDFKVTLQFSIILTTWIFSPMCLAIQPGRLLQDILFISSWNSDNEALYRTKWKFATTIFGAWVGAVVIPLDWDRPWQIWPIPCLVSTTFTFHMYNLVLTFHLFCTVFEIYHKIYASESNKIKNF